MNERDESTIDAVALIIQEGHVNKQSAHETAKRVDQYYALAIMDEVMGRGVPKLPAEKFNWRSHGGLAIQVGEVAADTKGRLFVSDGKGNVIPYPTKEQIVETIRKHVAEHATSYAGRTVLGDIIEDIEKLFAR